MRRLALVFGLDGRPVDPSELRLMLEAARGKGRGEPEVFVDGAVGLGAVEAGSVETELPERGGPSADAAGRRMVFAGRIDNRTDLAHQLEGRGIELAGRSNDEVFAAAYAAWGSACAERILGDFAFAVFDPARRRVLCARDVLGLKPLHYCRVGGTVYIASELRQLLAVPAVPRRPNEGMVGEYLAERITDLHETLYAGIYRLPPAHVLEVGPEGVSLQRYWDADLRGQLELQGDDAYAERLQELLIQAVRCRVADRKVVGALLSGGVDSTGVVGLARRLQRSADGPRFRLECFATTYEGHPEADERAAIESAAAFFGLQPHLIPAGRPSGGDFAAWVARDGEFPPYPGDLASDPLMVAAKACSCSVLLTGNGGDEWFWGFDSIWARLAGRFAAASSLRDRLALGPQLAAAVLTPALPRRLAGRLRAARHRRAPLPWIPRSFRRRSALDDRLTLDPRGRLHPRSPRQATAVALEHGALVHGREVAERYAAGFGIEERHPLHDRRIIEFALSLPPGQLLRDGTHKVALRAALAGAAPDSSRLRRDKAEFSHPVAEALLDGSIAASLQRPLIADCGWVVAEKVRAMLDEMAGLYRSGSPDYRRVMWPLWMVFGIETWYREAFPSS